MINDVIGLMLNNSEKLLFRYRLKSDNTMSFVTEND